MVRRLGGSQRGESCFEHSPAVVFMRQPRTLIFTLGVGVEAPPLTQSRQAEQTE
jgi:hypothetical protein